MKHILKKMDSKQDRQQFKCCVSAATYDGANNRLWFDTACFWWMKQMVTHARCRGRGTEPLMVGDCNTLFLQRPQEAAQILPTVRSRTGYRIGLVLVSHLVVRLVFKKTPPWCQQCKMWRPCACWEVSAILEAKLKQSRWAVKLWSIGYECGKLTGFSYFFLRITLSKITLN